MRVMVAADLHWNHPRSRESAEALIHQINRERFDVLLVVGDVGVGDGESIEECLSHFGFGGPKLFVPGNHELWSNDPEINLHDQELPERIESIGWRWLPREPFTVGDVGFVGSIGWYDYAFADAELEIPRLFYERKMSPGAVLTLKEPEDLMDAAQAAPEKARELVARWNDAKYVRLGMSDEAFVERECDRLKRELQMLADKRHVIAAIHTLPFEELLPPMKGGQFNFAKAFLGTPRIGEVLKSFDNVSHVVCGHSHYPMEAQVGLMRAINIGAGYRSKRFVVIEV